MIGCYWIVLEAKYGCPFWKKHSFLQMIDT